MKIVIQHQDEFPSKIREAIQFHIAPPERQANIVLSEIKSAIRQYFFGRSIGLDSSSDEWHGPNKDIDLGEEVEVAARLFPTVLTEKEEDVFPIFLLMTCPQAVCFVPIVASVVLQSKHSFFTESNLMYYIQRTLFHNRGDESDRLAFSITTIIGQQGGMTLTRTEDCTILRKPSVEYDEACLSALIQMRDSGLVSQHELYELLSHLFDFWNSTKTKELLKDADVLGFFQTRFQLLLDWQPSLLDSYGSEKHVYWNREYPKNEGFWLTLISKFDTYEEEVMDPIIRMVCKYGLSHYPRELGFIFSHNYVNMYMRSDMKATRQKAMKRIYEIGREEIATKMRENHKVIGQWVYSVAKNTAIFSADELALQRNWFPDDYVKRKVPPDGLYALIRSDPIRALTQSRINMTTVPWSLGIVGGKKIVELYIHCLLERRYARFESTGTETLSIRFIVIVNAQSTLFYGPVKLYRTAYSIYVAASTSDTSHLAIRSIQFMVLVDVWSTPQQSFFGSSIGYLLYK